MTLRKLTEARAARDSARAAFDERLAEIKGDLDSRSVGGRIADKLGEEARTTFDSALDVASESKLAIAGTVAALALWFLRGPIIGLVDQVLHGDGRRES